MVGCGGVLVPLGSGRPGKHPWPGGCTMRKGRNPQGHLRRDFPLLLSRLEIAGALQRSGHTMLIPKTAEPIQITSADIFPTETM